MENQDLQKKSLDSLFKLQQNRARFLSKSSASERIEKLKSIEKYIQDSTNFNRLFDALHQDLRKPEAEILASETGVVLSHSRFIRKNIKRWMLDKPVPSSLLTIGTSAYIQYEAKGVCLILSPWNYPFNLAILPLLYAIAAGNTVILKPSEIANHTSGYLKAMIEDIFEEDQVKVIEGGVEVAKSLLNLPFNHIFFTGSPTVGKIVMQAAAKHLTSVTLELGGKSPVIIDHTANARKSARKLAWGKCFNSGQTCIAPDYALVHHTKIKNLLDGLEASIQAFYNSDGKGIQQSNDYCRIINQKNFQRIVELVDDAVNQGAKIEIGGDFDATENYISPTVLTGVKPDMRIMQEEIFGPILPIVAYNQPDEAVDMINSLPKPLSMYIESKSKKAVKYFLKNTSAGGTVVNDFLLGYGNPSLPFGGVNNSGIGKSFGEHGFVEFSNERGVLKRKWGTMDFIFPPYTNSVNRILKLLSKWG